MGFESVSRHIQEDAIEHQTQYPSRKVTFLGCFFFYVLVSLGLPILLTLPDISF